MQSYVITIRGHKQSEEAAARCIESAKKYNTHVDNFWAVTPTNTDLKQKLKAEGIPQRGFTEKFSRRGYAIMIKEAISYLISGRSLTTEEAASVMEEIMQGDATPAQIGAFVTALRIKGETVDEIVGLAKTMRAKAIPVRANNVTIKPAIPTCFFMSLFLSFIQCVVLIVYENAISRAENRL